jgi:metal-sulfur cluster biosynthetic enzyme
MKTAKKQSVEPEKENEKQAIDQKQSAATTQEQPASHSSKQQQPSSKNLNEQIINAIKEVNDPEIGIDVHTLGLIYGVDIKESVVTITMTLTTPFCPYGPTLIEQVKEAVEKVTTIKSVTINLVFDPPWEPTAELRAMLGV